MPSRTPSAAPRHYGAIATDALALVPPSEIKTALEETVAFCIARAH